MESGDLKLMIPGPVEPHAEVMEAMGGPVVAHYGPEWTRIYNETTAMLGRVFGTAGDVFILVGSGSAAVDACLGSAVASGQQIIVGVNGFFGQRVANIASAYGQDVIPVEADLGEPLRAQDVEDAVRRHPAVRAIAIVHLETSTTVVNPVPEIGQVARRHNLAFIVDAVSSLGGLPFKMDEWGIDLCATASQKCLGAPPGLAPVAVGPGGWETIDRVSDPGHGWYLNLRIWREYATAWAHFHPFPTTQATNNVRALRVGLKQLLEEGIEKRLERYRDLARYLRRELRRIGYEPLTPDERMAPVLTGASGPPGVPTSEIVSFVANRHRIKISGGLGDKLADKIIRIGHMTPTMTKDDIDRVVVALEAFRSEKSQV